MHLGMFMQPLHNPKRDYTTLLQEDREAIILADELGFSECWIGEHFSAASEPITSPLIFFATLIERTKQIKFGTGVFCLPQAHPTMVASYAAMFDHLCQGRFLMGIGPGSLISDLELFKVQDAAVRPKMMLESIDMILQIWSQDPPYDIPGEFWDTTIKDMSRLQFGVGIMPKPYQKPHPPIGLSLITPGSSSAALAGERGWIPVSGNFIHSRYIPSHWERYVEGSEKAGRRPDPSIWRIARSILVTESDTQADDYISDPDGVLPWYFRYVASAFRPRGMLRLLKSDESIPDEEVSDVDIAKAMVLHGSPGRVLDQLVAVSDTFGAFGTLLCVAHDWDDKALWRRSMTLLAEEVMPRFRRHTASRVAAE